MTKELHSRRQTPRSSRPTESGFTLLEVAIVVGLTSVVALTLGNVILGTTSSVDYLMRDTRSVEEMQHMVSAIKDEIRDTGTANITIQPGTYYDTVYLQQARWNNVTSTMDHGAEDINGSWRSGWQVRYRVDVTDLKRELMPSSSVVNSSSTVATDLNVNTTGVKGFTVIKNGDLYTVRISTKETFDDGKTCQKSMQSTVRLQN